MKLTHRVRMLERKRQGKNCPVCNGQGRLVITCNSSYGEPSNPPLVGCECCGEILHIKIVEVEETLRDMRQQGSGGS